MDIKILYDNYTAGEGILHGVTRSHIIDYCSTGKLKMVYRTLRLQEVLGNRYEGIFISSTSMGAVPVRSLDGKRLDFDPSRWKVFDQALLAEGGLPDDPAAYVRRVNALLA